MSRVVPTREQGHLIVAGIRVLKHRQDRPPTLEEVAELIAIPAEQARVLVAELEECGVIRLLKTAFELRLAVDDHRAIEQLPEEKDAAGLDQEVRQFRQTFSEKQQEIQKTFGAEAVKKKTDDKMSRMADELKKFRERGGSGPRPSEPGSLPAYPHEDED